MPTEWDYMEVQVPVRSALASSTDWIKIRIDRNQHDNGISKKIEVSSNPFSVLKIQPWLEDRELITAPSGYEKDQPKGHISYEFQDTTSISLTTELSIDLVSINESAKMPSTYQLQQNYPNPFNSVTTIRYALPKSARVSLKIYDINGHEITKLVNEYQSAGNYQVKWNANNIASGEYFYQIEIDSYKSVRKMILMR